MMYYNIEGTMEFPDSMTKKEMNDLLDECSDFIGDEEMDYISFFGNEFVVCVPFDMQCNKLSEFLSIVERFNGSITNIRCDDHEAQPYPYSANYYCSRMLEMHRKGRKELIDFMQDMVETSFPRDDFRPDEGIFWIEK